MAVTLVLQRMLLFKVVCEKVARAVCTDDTTHAVVDPAANHEAAYLVAL
jgi:hypothetical protein